MITIGVLADTHVPDRKRRLHPDIIPLFEERNVQLILHAGDITIQSVLNQLEKVAPVMAVRGNQDVLMNQKIPIKQVITVGRVRIGMTHGHGNWRKYLRDKYEQLFEGPGKFSKWEQRAVKLFEKDDVDVIVFGHNHEPLIRYPIDGKIIFNPGSAAKQVLPNKPPSIGFLTIDGTKVTPEIVFLSDKKFGEEDEQDHPSTEIIPAERESFFKRVSLKIKRKK